MKKEYELQNGKTVVFEYDENRIGKVTVEAMDCLIDMLPKWIPCSERLPDVGTPVLGSFEVEGDRYILGTSICVIYGEIAWTGTMGIKPIAWMPLPEPYKGEEE